MGVERAMKLSTILLWIALLCPVLSFNANAEPLGRNYFGVHIHRPDQDRGWPDIPFGSWRLWDTYVTWSDLEPEEGRWEFLRLDRYVRAANQIGVDLLLPLANTPRWAASRPDEPSGYRPGNASFPREMAKWRRYVRTVAGRYRGKIRYYEIWNEPNIYHHYSGTVEQLVQLACEARQVLREVDPQAILVSPAASSGKRGHVEYLNSFLRLGGAACVDVIAHHFYVPDASMIELKAMVKAVRRVMRDNGVEAMPLWNTESGLWLSDKSDQKVAPYLRSGGWKRIDSEADGARLVLASLLVARSEGVDRFFWYSWDHRGGLGILDAENGQQKAAADGWRRAYSAMLGATSVLCDVSVRRTRCVVKYVASPDYVLDLE